MVTSRLNNLGKILSINIVYYKSPTDSSAKSIDIKLSAFTKPVVLMKTKGGISILYTRKQALEVINDQVNGKPFIKVKAEANTTSATVYGGTSVGKSGISSKAQTELEETKSLLKCCLPALSAFVEEYQKLIKGINDISKMSNPYSLQGALKDLRELKKHMDELVKVKALLSKDDELFKNLESWLSEFPKDTVFDDAANKIEDWFNKANFRPLREEIKGNVNKCWQCKRDISEPFKAFIVSCDHLLCPDCIQE